MLQKTAGEENVQPALEQLPPEYSWLEGKQSFVACAFYTPNYLPQISSLKASLEAHGISHFLKCYQRLSTWEATTRLKPVFIDYCLNKFPGKDILYLDADAVVRKPLTFFETAQSDVAMVFHPTKVGRNHYLRISAGTVFVRNTAGGRQFAKAWKDEEVRCGPITVDEDMIYMAFDKLQGISITVLPLAYYKVFDKPGVEPVIEHFQASRSQFKWRRLIRKARRIGTGVAVAAALGLIWWLSQHLTWR